MKISLSTYETKCPIKIHEHGFPFILPYSGQNTHNLLHVQSCMFFNLSLHTISQNDLINSFSCIINPNTPLWSHMRFSIFHPFWQNSHNIHLQATNISNIHTPPIISQIYTFGSKVDITLTSVSYTHLTLPTKRIV